MDSNFTLVERPYGIRWLCKNKPLWIVYYPNSSGNQWQAYRPADHISSSKLKNRDPWTLDNRKMSDGGFKSFAEAEAAAAVEDYEWEA